MKENQVTESWIAARYIQEDGTILDFTGLYDVSDQGRVKSLNYRGHTGKEGILSPITLKAKCGSIYYMVNLFLNNKSYMIQTHRLVLSSFKESEFFEGAVCDHIVARSETNCDNRLTNLRWVTVQQNVSTEHCKEVKVKALTNHPTLSRRIRVTDLTTGETIVYPSAKEAGRSLGINPRVPPNCVKYRNGYYKKLNLRFEYM